MKARNLVMSEFDPEQNAESIKIDESGEILKIDWKDGAKSRFSSDWLRFRNPSDPEARKIRRQVYLFPEDTWDRAIIEKRLKKVDFHQAMVDDKALHDFLEAVCLDGISILTGAEPGKLGATHFGRTFEVATKSDASNMAYAHNNALPFHTDFPSLEQPPQLQMLHMLHSAREGGNSLFVDGFHVANLLRHERPDVFRILTTTTLEFIEEGFDVHEGDDGKPRKFEYDMCARHETIKLDQSGRIKRIQFGNAMRSWFYDVEPEKIQDIYRSLKIFTNYCYDPKNILKIRLEEGDTVLWANTRLLHTRDSYINKPEKVRTLTGCYFDWDFVKSRVRLLRDRLNLPQNQPSI
ncbi:hypothetical protein WR25_05047 [Diploscapter pachys]|uniref:TauD/TfdA-like domain-containing protein n=1 Tax=Diploscapter pachys TaxID=2018661 RepID=A0A2A2J547_9BILA|nr:hypothetical protein WR25_05047 [Diploscapter pachys]